MFCLVVLNCYLLLFLGNGIGIKSWKLCFEISTPSPIVIATALAPCCCHCQPLPPQPPLSSQSIAPWSRRLCCKSKQYDNTIFIASYCIKIHFNPPICTQYPPALITPLLQWQIWAIRAWLIMSPSLPYPSHCHYHHCPPHHHPATNSNLSPNQTLTLPPAQLCHFLECSVWSSPLAWTLMCSLWLQLRWALCFSNTQQSIRTNPLAQLLLAQAQSFLTHNNQTVAKIWSKRNNIPAYQVMNTTTISLH